MNLAQAAEGAGGAVAGHESCPAAAAAEAFQEAPAQPPLLLSMPEGLVATHVIKHLGPHARAQLRSTCKLM